MGQIDTDASTNALLKIAYGDGNVGSPSLARLTGRRIPRRLSPDELESWIKQLQNGNADHAGMVARLLSLCSFNDVQKRADSIVARFIKEILVQKSASKAEITNSYLSPQALRLTQFLVAFLQFHDMSVVRSLQRSAKLQTDPAVLKWLKIGIGFAGDASVAPELRLMVDQEKDASTKAIALRAYSRAANGEALPLLKRYLNDPTVTNQGMHGPQYGLQMVARGEIARLQIKQSKPANP